MAQVKRGFTLTELLVVIAIIAILASLGTVAVMRAMTTARATAIKTELDQIDAAMKRYKETYGSYPPCNLAFDDPSLSAADKQARLGPLRQHFAMAFPRYNADEARLRRDLTEAGIDLENFRPDQALVFWLQGFSADPMSPVLAIDSRPIDPTTGAVDRTPTGPKPQKRTNNFFEFDASRLIGVESGTITNPAPSYFPPNARVTTNQVATKTFPEYGGGGPPIVYFDARSYGTPPTVGGDEAHPTVFNDSGLFAGAGYVFPYWDDRNKNERTNLAADESSQENWANPDSFQLIAAGGDNKYFVIDPMPTLPMDAHLVTSGMRIDRITEGDNAVNFMSSARLEDDLP